MDLKKLVISLISQTNENEWIEYKVNNYNPQLIGEYLSALSNSACLNFEPFGYLIFGVKDKTNKIVGTRFNPTNAKGKGSESLEPWLRRLLNPRINFKISELWIEEHKLVVFQIDAAPDQPVKFKGTAYIRIGEHKHKLSEHPALEKKIWNNANLKKDWSAQIAEGAYLEHLDDDAIEKAKKEFKTKHKQSNFYLEIDGWNDLTFLNKAKLAINGKLTFAAIILLGKQESTHFINPAVARISWILKDKNGIELDYFHFDPPFLLNVDKLFNKIRNLTIRELPDGTLFPIEIDQYDNWVMREALHNCIAHQDYRMQNRITILENPDDLVFVNSGSFLPGSIENVLEQNAPHSIYPNKQLTEAMVNLNMIDIIGSGIRRMFISQRNRFMPLPGYDLSIENKVRVKLIGKVLDGEYTKALIKNTELTLAETILLDKVQKRHKISQEAHQLLKKKKLVEGRYPNIFVSSEVAQKTDRKVEYQKYKAFNTGYYKDMILAFIKRNHSASPEELNQLILGKLPDNLSVTQKKNRLRNIMYDMSHRDQTIKNNGKRGNHTKWYIKLD